MASVNFLELKSSVHLNIIATLDCILAMRFATELGGGGLRVGWSVFCFGVFCFVWFCLFVCLFYIFVFLGINVYIRSMYFSVF